MLRTRSIWSTKIATAALLVALFVVLVPRTAIAAIERYAVIIGNNEGHRGDVPLRYAERDAERVAEVLRDLGGFAPHDIVLLLGEERDTVLAALRDIEQRSVARARDGVDTVLFVYYSGHADAQALHLGATTLDLRQLGDFVRDASSRVRLLVVDACRSGALTRTKGGQVEAPFEVRVDEHLVDEGVVFLSSTAADEDAQESDELQASFFTHYLLSGLLGAADRNADMRVSLTEAYRYAYEHTLRASSQTFAGVQHPTFSYDLRGQGELTLATLDGRSSKRATLLFPADMDYMVFKDDREGPVVAEVMRTDHGRTLELSAGRYFIRARADDHLREGHLDVAPRTDVRVDPTSLARIEYARLVRKGTDLRKVSHGLQAGYRFRTSLVRGGSLCHGAALGYAIELRHVSLVPRVGYCRGAFGSSPIRAHAEELDVSLHLSHVFDLPVVSIELGVVGGAGLLRQTFDTTRVAPPRLTASGQLGVMLGLVWDLPRGFYVVTEAAAHTYFFERAPTGGAREIATVFAVRPMFGLGKRW